MPDEVQPRALRGRRIKRRACDGRRCKPLAAPPRIEEGLPTQLIAIDFDEPGLSALDIEMIQKPGWIGQIGRTLQSVDVGVRHLLAKSQT
jgi:hypothetical protein